MEAFYTSLLITHYPAFLGAKTGYDIMFTGTCMSLVQKWKDVAWGINKTRLHFYVEFLIFNQWPSG